MDYLKWVLNEPANMKKYWVGVSFIQKELSSKCNPQISHAKECCGRKSFFTTDVLKSDIIEENIT